MKHLPQKKIPKTPLKPVSHRLESQCKERPFRETGPAALVLGKQTGYLGDLIGNSFGHWSFDHWRKVA